MRKIQDQFAKRPVSRQRKWQLRRQQEGKCIICGDPKVTSMFCLKHAIQRRELQRTKVGSRRRYKSLTYRLGKEVKTRRRTSTKTARA